MSASALPSRTSSTAFAADASLYGASTIGMLAEVDAVLLRHRLDARLRADQDRRDEPEARRIDGAAQRALVARMRDRGGRRRQRLAEIEQLLVLRVWTFHDVRARAPADGLRAALRTGLAYWLYAPARSGPARATESVSPMCSIIASCSLDGFARCTRSSASNALHERDEPRAVLVVAQELRQRRERLVRRVADDDLLLAAHAAPLVGRHRRAAGPCIPR